MDAMARGLTELGLVAGERIAVFLTNDNGRECILTALGALACGAVIVPLNTRSSDEELSHALELVDPKFVVCAESAARRMAKSAPRARLLIINLEEDTPDYEAWPDPEHQPSGRQPERLDDPDVLACLLFTSGTTARAKAVMTSHRTMIATGLCCSLALGLSSDDLYQGAFPFFTSSALNLACMSCWVIGAGLVLEGAVDSAERLRLIQREGTTFYHGVPSVLNFMLQEEERGGYELGGLRRIANGGAPMPADLVRRIAERWPWADQIQIYGLTESGPTGSVLKPDEIVHKAGSVGQAMPFCRLDVVGKDGASLPAGEPGEIAITGPGVAVGYFRNVPATDAVFHGRRVLTGDVGWLDEDGFLFFADRKKDVINRGGLKIASVAVESALYAHPAVHEAAVVGVPHVGLGEDVAACVVLHANSEVDRETLVRHCAARLADYSVPRKWLFLDELPKNPMGKVLKTELRAMFERNLP
jgi:acyl-CoA synthetase (AMP-forming)/AMP-acid ligase II